MCDRTPADFMTAAQKISEAELQLRAASHKQSVEGDLAGAIKLYESIVSSKTADRAVKAKALLQLDRIESTGAPNATKVWTLANLAEQLRLSGEYAESEKLFGGALQLLRTTSNVDRTYAPVILSCQGRMYQEAGKYAQAESSLKEALRLTERDLGRDHAHRAQVLSFLGDLYTVTGKWKAAESRFKTAIALEESRPTPDKAALGLLLANFAALYETSGLWKYADPLVVRALPSSRIR
jgi:tetratricopeptide (TPR) repeat protein